MAMPNSKNNVTVRKLASALQGLWYKVKNAFLLKTSRGAANGVASLDANGKVPSSQLPIVPTGNLPANSSSSAGIVASGSGQANKVWMTDSSGNPSWRRGSTQFLYDYTFGIGGLGPGYIHIGTLTPRGAAGETDQLLFSGIGGIGDFQKLVLVQVMFRGSSPGIKSTVLDGGTTYQTLFGWYKDSNNVYHMMMKLANWSSTSECLRVLYKGNTITFDFYNLDSEPANVTYVDNYYVTRSPMGQSVGNASTPVYVNSSGEIVACTNVPAALDDLDARMGAVEDSLKEENLGTRTADEIDSKVLKIGGDDVSTLLAGKVDKVEGKGLSKNDFTDAYKSAVDANTSARHTHSNKSVLDGISSSDITNWNGKQSALTWMTNDEVDALWDNAYAAAVAG